MTNPFDLNNDGNFDMFERTLEYKVINDAIDKFDKDDSDDDVLDDCFGNDFGDDFSDDEF